MITGQEVRKIVKAFFKQHNVDYKFEVKTHQYCEFNAVDVTIHDVPREDISTKDIFATKEQAIEAAKQPHKWLVQDLKKAIKDAANPEGSKCKTVVVMYPIAPEGAGYAYVGM